MEIELKTIKTDEKFLRQISKEVDFNDKSYLGDIKLIDDYFNNKPKPLFALASVQIGIPKKIIYLRNTTADMSKNRDKDYNEKKVLINPIILEEKGHTRYLEHCGSCLNYSAVVDRPYQIDVEYYDINGNKRCEHFEGLAATIISHEYDHLNGILHLDLTDNIMELEYDEVLRYRKEHPYEIVSKDCEYIKPKRNEN
ncbi:MAG: peptide deformylase [Bacilli bacterium]